MKINLTKSLKTIAASIEAMVITLLLFTLVIFGTAFFCWIMTKVGVILTNL